MQHIERVWRSIDGMLGTGGGGSARWSLNGRGHICQQVFGEDVTNSVFTGATLPSRLEADGPDSWGEGGEGGGLPGGSQQMRRERPR